MGGGSSDLSPPESNSVVMDVVIPPETTTVVAAQEASRKLALELMVYGGSPLASLGSDPRTTADVRPRENA